MEKNHASSGTNAVTCTDIPSTVRSHAAQPKPYSTRARPSSLKSDTAPARVVMRSVSVPRSTHGNFPPAKLRPGSCGCLYLAGVLGCVPLCIGYAELSIPLALPFWAEGGMVLLQILYHRITGRPLFRAAPLHRWLEARGAGPVTVFYWLCALGVCGLALALAFVR